MRACEVVTGRSSPLQLFSLFSLHFARGFKKQKFCVLVECRLIELEVSHRSSERVVFLIALVNSVEKKGCKPNTFTQFPRYKRILSVSLPLTQRALSLCYTFKLIRLSLT